MDGDKLDEIIKFASEKLQFGKLTKEDIQSIINTIKSERDDFKIKMFQYKYENVRLKKKYEQDNPLKTYSHDTPEELWQEIRKLNKKLEKIAGMCGNPNAVDACRLIMKECKI